jgi:hypothetical protein
MNIISNDQNYERQGWSKLAGAEEGDTTDRATEAVMTAGNRVATRHDAGFARRRRARRSLRPVPAIAAFRHGRAAP